MACMDSEADVMSPRYCGPPGRGPIRLLLDRMGSGRADLSGLPQLSGPRVVFTRSARVGIEMLCRSWGWGSDDRVLVPAYHCGTEVDALIAGGVRVDLYRVDASLNIDLADIVARLTPSTRAVYVIHYFGFAQPLAGLAGLCTRYGLKLIEDCALALFSNGAAGPIGCAGDAAVFSIPKTLAAPDGGAVVWRSGVTNECTPVMGCARSVARGTLPLVKRAVLRRCSRAGLGRIANRIARVSRPPTAGSVRADMPGSYYFDRSLRGAPMSRLTRGILAATHTGEVVSRRRRNFEALAEGVRGVQGVAPLFDTLPAGVCPLVYPLLVPDRNRLIADLARDGVEVIPWWAGYHRDFGLTGFAEASFLKDNVAALPIHQDLNDDDVSWVADRVRASVRTEDGPRETCAAARIPEVVA